MAGPPSAGPPAAPRAAGPGGNWGGAGPVGIGRRAVPVAITPTVTHTAITAAPITGPTMAAATTVSMPLPRFTAAAQWRPGSRAGARRRLRPPRHEATTIPITTRRPISGNEHAGAVPPVVLRAE